jgi:hypothetical protein
MRCPQCGTHNEPDSRFCGGCGARLAGTLAPTQKISPDVQFAPGPIQPQPTTLQRQPPPPNSASQPSARPASGQQPLARPSSAPQPVQQRQPSAPQPVARASQPSVPPIGQRGPRAQSVPPASNGVPASVRPARGSLADASLSIAPAHGRPWGVIIVVLVIDLALAATGGWLLSQGLADPPAPTPGSAAKTGSTSGETKAIGTIAPAVAMPAARITPPPAPPRPANPSTVMPVTPPEPAAAPEKPSPPKARKRPSKVKPAGGPVDPYNEPPPPGPPLPPYPPPPAPPPLHEPSP